ncbi:alpha-mannosidase [Simiduia agarivorans]|uniref:Glycosyl hydrolase 38 domain-containing protein n=1 Tax=Simiduia agarivorans (strain DSM 21679 / JCM 13881 / BCRC 17597 / SA1) TaxID=1117647 RepID=K4KMN6_SIMAS|nr:glycoside hydrolase family 38 C-terminal domain-containing protein [Simiduia agarivorans]AFV00440.1 glycosyl hydrolase 38 domain-containing protein [Simiduia agarivorans SA1 = DSM 21679]
MKIAGIQPLLLITGMAMAIPVMANSNLVDSPLYKTVSDTTRDYIARAAAGDHLALEGGHMALDGHVMPYMYFQAHEILFLDRLGKLRHRTVWATDAVSRVDHWQDAFIKDGLPKDAVMAAPGELVGGRHSQIGYEFILPALPESQTGWERFFTLKPMDMSVPGWPETTIYVDGIARAALQRKHFYWALDKLGDSTRPQRITLKSFGVFDQPRGYREVAVVERDPLADDVYWKLRVLIEASTILNDDSVPGRQIRALIDKAIAAVNLEVPHTPVYRQQLQAANQLLAEGFTALAKLPQNNERLRVMLHGHLDSAWRWTLDHTDDKLLRLALNNLYLMDRFPEYRYIFTTPFHYERIQALYPDVFERIKTKINAGQWIANGSTYVETDLNLPGGESVVRQFLYGLDYYRNTLGVKDNALFLPDTFGYPQYFPQIAQDFGLDSLVAMRANTPEIDSTLYRWRGLDGSELLVNSLSTPAWEYPYEEVIHGRSYDEGHWITTYNAPDAGPRRLAGTWAQFKNKAETDQQLLLVGWGDGGAGGTEDHVELIRRVTDLPGFPRVQWTNMYDYLEQQNRQREQFPLFDGRILARPWIQRTFMQASGIKQANRRAEQRLQEAEALASYASLSGFEYPQSEFKQIWKSLLLQHFHDIVTGMAVPEVLERAARDLADIEQRAAIIRDQALAHILREADLADAGLVVYNPAATVASGVVNLGKVDLAGVRLLDASGNVLAHERDAVGNLWVDLPDLAPQTFTHLRWGDKPEVSASSGELSVRKGVLENALVRVTFNQNGQISSYFDKVEQRELVPVGKVWNQFMRIPHQTGVAEPFSARAKIDQEFTGHLRAGMRLNWRKGKSRVVQQVWLAAHSRQLQFDTHIDWQEDHRLAVEFPLNINSREAHYGMPFGFASLSRGDYDRHAAVVSPIAVHEWADVSEGGYGVALLDRTRYAYNLKSGGLRLNLAWGQHKHEYQEMHHLHWSESGSGDAGGMQMSYALLPHQGDLLRGGVIEKAKTFNHSLLVAANAAGRGLGRGLPAPMIKDLPANVAFPSIKRTEAGDAIALRLYETGNQRTRWSPPAGARSATLAETPSVENPALFTPFEIKTLIVND